MPADASEVDRVARQSILASMDKTLVLNFASQKQVGVSTGPPVGDALSPNYKSTAAPGLPGSS